MSNQQAGLFTPPHAQLIDDTFGRHIGVKETDARRLAWLASQVPENGIIVEVGSFWGRSAGYMASAMHRSVQLFCVDKWPNLVDLEKFKRNISSLALGHFNVQTMRGESVEMSKKWSGRPIDLLYIDATHTYAMVQADYLAWAPFVRPGGLIAFHDYGARTWPAVKRFVDEVASLEFQQLGIHQHVWSGVKR
ncbi:MAG: class I SAM-dependent methyltransferase [Anaerolineales bacterium]|jgi:predicted O-methyltransferase YrrM|nr:class I SAM-dependent methyltransferase [Anaerolineales bacterium]